MKTIWVLAKNRTSATSALRKNLMGFPADNDFIEFKFIATADCIEEPDGQFLVVKGWKQNPSAKEITEALKNKNWEQVKLGDIYLS